MSLGDWKERAEAAYQADTAGVLKVLLKTVLDVDAEPKSERIELDGVLFVASYARNFIGQEVRVLEIRKPCGTCGKEVHSEPLHRLIDVAYALHWQPETCMHCEPIDDGPAETEREAAVVPVNSMVSEG